MALPKKVMSKAIKFRIQLNKIALNIPLFGINAGYIQIAIYFKVINILSKEFASN